LVPDFCYIWRKQIYQYTCIENGVSEGPRLFTKLLKPVYARLRSLGYVNSGFIDDSYNEYEENIKATVNLMLQVGFSINEEVRINSHNKIALLGEYNRFLRHGSYFA
jgi:hypothetical protein